MNPRAITYRRLNAIPESWGTAVNVQAMVFGNMGETSATGVAFTRNPSTGASELYGEFLVNAQGEDVVAGIRTPQNITEAARIAAHSDMPSMEAVMPAVFADFAASTELLERHYRDMQDIEFTVERGKLWMLQTRGGKRTAQAALRIAVEMAQRGPDRRATRRSGASTRRSSTSSSIRPSTRMRRATSSPRACRPRPARRRARSSSRPTRRERLAATGRKVILVRVETSPEDIDGMHAARGHPDDARRHDLACGGGGARHGQALRVRRRDAARRPGGRDRHGRRPRAEARRHRSRSTAPPARCCAAR